MSDTTPTPDPADATQPTQPVLPTQPTQPVPPYTSPYDVATAGPTAAAGTSSYDQGPYGAPQQDTPPYGTPTTGGYNTDPYGTPYGSYPTVGLPYAAPVAPIAPPGTTAARRGNGRTVALVLATALLAGGVGGGIGAAVGSSHESTTASTSSLTSQTSNAPASVNLPAGSVEAVAAKVLPSVVSIVERSTDGSGGEGSGIVLSSDGLVLTNNHVVAGASGGGSLQVTTQDGKTYDATVVGTDPTSDLAVVRVKGVSGWSPATLGSSANLVVGQSVVAVGSPLGLSGTVTSGIVSALNRPVTTSGDTTGQTTSSGAVLNAIQTDAAINPGNSGGPLVDLNGHVVGINSAIASLGSSAGSSQSGSIGLGFAIPIDQAKRIADELISSGKATHPQLGVQVADGTNGGALLQGVTAGGAADKAGLQVGDVITAVNGRPVDSADSLVADIRSSAPGATVSITFTRSGASQTVSVVLGQASS
ncbi:MAG TPA: trypsin-like peptidase domain-containing protein [Actinomycetes bacterium]